MSIIETSNLLHATPVKIEHNLLVLDVGFAGVVTGSKRRWRELLLQSSQ
jgi:hypothetical protein